MKSTLPFIVSLALLAASIRAAQLTIPANLTLNAQDVDSGPSFTVSGNFGPTDTFGLRAQGIIDLSSGDYQCNAAGVITGPSTTHTGNHPGEILLNDFGPPPFYPFGTILLGNDALGFFPVFPADALRRPRQRYPAHGPLHQ